MLTPLLAACLATTDAPQSSASLNDLGAIVKDPAAYEGKTVRFTGMIRNEGNYFRAHVPFRAENGSIQCYDYEAGHDDPFYPLDLNYSRSVHFEGRRLRSRSFTPDSDELRMLTIEGEFQVYESNAIYSGTQRPYHPQLYGLVAVGAMTRVRVLEVHELVCQL